MNQPPMTAEQISATPLTNSLLATMGERSTVSQEWIKLREHARTLERTLIAVTKQPPIPPTLEQAAARAAEAICGDGKLFIAGNGWCDQSELTQIILAHVAPCCGVNQKLADACMVAISYVAACGGTDTNTFEVLKSAIQSTQTQPKETNEH